MPTRVRHQIHHGLDALERHQRPQMPAMPRLPASPASTLLPTAAKALSAGEAVGRGRLRCGRRVLLPQRELPLQIGDPFLGVRDPPFGLLQLPFTFGQFATKPFVLLLQSLLGVRTPVRSFSPQHATDGTPIRSICTDRPLNSYGETVLVPSSNRGAGQSY